MRRFLVELLLLAVGCDVEGTIGIGYDPNRLEREWADLRFELHPDVDILFVVDNTAHMAPKQTALGQALGNLAGELFQLPPHHFHFGVVTTDLGAGKAEGDCVAPGDDGLLVAHGRAATDDCQGPIGARFVDLEGGTGGNLPPGQSLATTLGCMVQVGDHGCGYPQPLEAMRRALVNPANAGFLREGSLLEIVFVTDGDDCSAPSDSPVFGGGRLGCLVAGVECGDPPHPPDASGASCRPRDGAGLYDLARYRDTLFHATRDPNAVGVVVVAGPDNPVAVSGGEVVPSCVAAGDPGYSALPAVRLQALAETTPRSVVGNLCAPGAVQYALGSLAIDLLAPDPGAACLPAPIANLGEPECEVTLDGKRILDCNSSGGAVPCWELQEELTCLPVYNPRDKKNEQLALRIRDGVSGQIGNMVTARCLVIVPRK
jgi:hypothetical protein